MSAFGTARANSGPSGVKAKGRPLPRRRIAPPPGPRSARRGGGGRGRLVSRRRVVHVVDDPLSVGVGVDRLGGPPSADAAARRVDVRRPIAPEQLEHLAHVGTRLLVRRDGARGLHDVLARVVGGQRQALVPAEKIQEILQITHAADDVLHRIERIGHPEAGRGLGHELHQALRALGRDGPRVEVRLDRRHRIDELRAHPVVERGPPDHRAVLLAGVRSRERAAARVGPQVAVVGPVRQDESAAAIATIVDLLARLRRAGGGGQDDRHEEGPRHPPTPALRITFSTISKVRSRAVRTASEFLPPASAMSGLPPPRPSIKAASSLTISPACSGGIRSRLTEAVTVARSSRRPHCTITPDGTLARPRSTSARSASLSRPSCGPRTSTLTPETSRSSSSAGPFPPAAADTFRSSTSRCNALFCSSRRASVSCSFRRSTLSAPCSRSTTRRSSRSSWSAPRPASASMRRMPAAMPRSCVTLSSPIDPVLEACVPPHSSRLKPGTSITRTTSPYLSPKKARAPRRSASSSGIVVARIGRSWRMTSFTSSSTCRRISSDSG